MLRAGRLFAALVAVLAMSGSARADEPAADLKAALEDVSGADAVRYDARDDQGAPLDGLDVLALPGSGYVGVHHALIGGRFEARVATSDDLLNWRHRATLDTDAAMPAIAPTPDGGYVVAYEHGSTMRVLPRTDLPTAIAGPTGLWMLNKNQLRFRAYPTLAALLAAKPSRRFTAPRRLSRTDEGTPDITVRGGSSPDDLVLDIGLHHFADLDGDRIPDADRQGTGTLRSFRRWSAAPAPGIDALFTRAGQWHDGFTGPPAGSIGDRDRVTFGGARFVLHEAQYAPHAFGTWRLFMRAAGGGPAIPLAPRTHGGSRAFGNPSVAVLPDGLLFSAFVFSEGAAPGEAGAMIAVRRP